VSNVTGRLLKLGHFGPLYLALGPNYEMAVFHSSFIGN